MIFFKIRSSGRCFFKRRIKRYTLIVRGVRFFFYLYRIAGIFAGVLILRAKFEFHSGFDISADRTAHSSADALVLYSIRAELKVKRGISLFCTKKINVLQAVYKYFKNQAKRPARARNSPQYAHNQRSTRSDQNVKCRWTTAKGIYILYTPRPQRMHARVRE